MSALEKAMVLALLARSSRTRSQTLAEIGIPRRTYYNWVKQKKDGGKKSENRRPWNRIKTEEEKLVIDHARASPELSPRQLCLKLVDDYGCWLSESTVYRLLKREGLVKRIEIKGFDAGKEYHGRMKCGLPTAAI
jgi:transposase